MPVPLNRPVVTRPIPLIGQPRSPSSSVTLSTVAPTPAAGVNYQKPIQVDELTWRLKWTSNQTPPVTFRVVKQGRVIATFTSQDGSGQWDFTIPPGDNPFIEVLDEACLVPSIAFPGRMLLHWQSVADAVKYRIEEFVASVWTLRQTIDDDGRGAFTWESRWLEDATNHQFRIIPVDAAENQGTATTVVALMVRHPDAPDVSYAYNGAGAKTWTISAA